MYVHFESSTEQFCSTADLLLFFPFVASSNIQDENRPRPTLQCTDNIFSGVQQKLESTVNSSEDIIV